MLKIDEDCTVLYQHHPYCHLENDLQSKHILLEYFYIVLPFSIVKSVPVANLTYWTTQVDNFMELLVTFIFN